MTAPKLGISIESDLRKILNLIKTYPATLAISPTGTGKSLGIPYGVARSGHRIMVSVPTRKAAMSLQREMIRRLKRLRLNIRVGYAAGGDVRYTKDTQIIYATAGHIYRKILSLFRSDQKNFATHLANVLMIDEFHRGDIDADMIFLLWQYGVRLSDISMPALVLASATPTEVNLSSEFLGVYQASLVSSYTIEVEYSSHNYNPYDRSLLNDAANLAIDFHRTVGLEGHFLIFAAGTREVSTIANRINKVKLEKVMILQAYGLMDPELLSKLNDPAPKGIRKIIIATNVAETSLTIRDVGVVIDTMSEKRDIVSAGGGTRLMTEYISKDSADQRKGRTGRTMNGLCHRMITEAGYRKLLKSRPKEITIIPLYNQVMDLLGASINPPSILPISSDDYDRTLRKLRRLKLIDERNKATEAGIMVSSLPLGLEAGTMIWKWLSTKLEYSVLPCVVVATMIDRHTGSYFVKFDVNTTSLPGDRQRLIRSRVEKDKHKQFRGYSDIHTYLKLWKGLTDYLGGIDGSYHEIRNWATENAIRYVQMKEVRYVVQKIMRELTEGRGARSVAIGRIASTRKAVGHLEPIITDVYRDKRMSKVRLGEYRSKWNDVYALDTVQSYNLLRVSPPDFIHGILIRKVGHRSIVNCAFAMKPENQRVLAPAGFTLGMTPVERQEVVAELNQESNTADELSKILEMIE